MDTQNFKFAKTSEALTSVILVVFRMLGMCGSSKTIRLMIEGANSHFFDHALMISSFSMFFVDKNSQNLEYGTPRSSATHPRTSQSAKARRVVISAPSHMLLGFTKSLVYSFFMLIFHSVKVV
jgi:hypothetical protein